ncbi:hypothetical protein AB0I30_33565 [Nocardia tengchongensis]|uniref:hypothetical protein n=1 Tax=Nocardia tengchongensis TaxID=2055889 RepID=UPI0033F5098D
MNIKKTGRYAAVGVAAAAAAVQLSAGTATAATGSVSLWVGGGPDLLSCKATAQKCQVIAYVYDMSTPITITANGKTVISGLPVASQGTVEPGQLATLWIPQTAGSTTITAQQGSQSQSFTIQIIDNNGPEAFAKRTDAYLRSLACKTGSATISAGCGAGVDPL